MNSSLRAAVINEWRGLARQKNATRPLAIPGRAAKAPRFDRLVARYYPAVYSFAARLTDDPRDAVARTREAFNGARKQLQSIRSQTAIATILVSAVIRPGLAPA